MTNFAQLSQQAAVARTLLPQLSNMLAHAGLHIDNAPTFLRAHYGEFSVIIAIRHAGEQGKMYIAVQRTPVTDRSTKRFFFRNGTYNLTGIYNAVVQPFTAWRDGRAKQAITSAGGAA